MALLDSFKKKEEPQGVSPKQQASVDMILSMKNQGYSNEQIVQSLYAQGYDPQSVYDAINQAEVKMTMEYQAPQQYPDIQLDSGMSKEKIEEIAEAIIDEKWNEFSKNLDVIVKWKDRTETRLIEIEEAIKHLKEDFNKVHSSVLAKVGEYDTHIMNVSTTLKAMEQAFTKVLPVFAENVSELSRITRTMKDIQTAKKGKE